MKENDYKEQLQALLPQGAAWSRDPKANLTKLLSGFAAEYARIDQRSSELINEVLPSNTSEMLTDWERVLDIFSDENLSPEQRQQKIIEKLNQRGEQSKSFFIALAASVGFQISITEFTPFRVGIKHIGEALTNGEWVFCWEIAINESGSNYNSLIDLITRYKPTHTKVSFIISTASTS